MARIHVHLPWPRLRVPKGLARGRGVSVAALIRESVNRFIQSASLVDALARFHAARAHVMELYLQQGEIP